MGGAPQRLAQVLFNQDGSVTPMAIAITEVYNVGGLIVGGIPGPGGAHTGLDVMLVLEQGRVPEEKLYRGLGLMMDGWHVDQHFFTQGRFAETLVTMRQLGLDYGIGVAANSVAVIKDDQLEAAGEGGVMIIDLARATSVVNDGGFNLKRARLSYLNHGDRIDLKTLQIVPNPNVLDAVEIDPNTADHQPMIENRMVTYETFADNGLLELLRIALDSQLKQTIGLVFRDGANDKDLGFQFRFYAGKDTTGW